MQLAKLPRLPLEGSLDLTYRCNNNCRHCWLRIPPQSQARKDELSFPEIKDIVAEARQLGCRTWYLSGGEPMLRPDFPEIFDYLTSKSVSYTLNTNGSLLTPEIARLLRRKGSKMVALYGATAAVHDHITRTPGSFAATMQGFAYLKEAGAGFIVQIVPMRDNVHEYDEMVKLAQSLSPHQRIGASWFYLAADGSPRRNAEIRRQRLDPREVVKLVQPSAFADNPPGDAAPCRHAAHADRLFARCIAGGRQFHIDPYGHMSFCSFIKDPAFRYNLRHGNFTEAWEVFIPSLAERIREGSEYRQDCAVCDLRSDCYWCDVFSYLEHGRYGAKIDHLCCLARETRAYKEAWARDHRRFYDIAGITLQVEADLPITSQTFQPRFDQFRVERPGSDVITVQHHFYLPRFDPDGLENLAPPRLPWKIYRQARSWIYHSTFSAEDHSPDPRLAVFNQDYSRGVFFRDRQDLFLAGQLPALTLFQSDQALLSQVLADRRGCIFHSSGVILDGHGLVFMGQSGAGKSTMVKLLQGRAEILCDDRNIIRRWPERFQVHGTWWHGEVPIVSPAHAPLTAICFLHQSRENILVRLEKPRDILGGLLSCVVRPFITTDWWRKVLTILELIVREVPCYRMEFDQSGAIVPLLAPLVQERPARQRDATA